jgi:hypothetical protein
MDETLQQLEKTHTRGDVPVVDLALCYAGEAIYSLSLEARKASPLPAVYGVYESQFIQYVLQDELISRLALGRDIDALLRSLSTDMHLSEPYQMMLSTLRTAERISRHDEVYFSTWCGLVTKLTVHRNRSFRKRFTFGVPLTT